MVLGAERLDVAVAPLEQSPSAVLAAMVAAKWSPLVPVMPPTVLLILLLKLGMLARWLMQLLLLLLLLCTVWSDTFVGCDDV